MPSVNVPFNHSPVMQTSGEYIAQALNTSVSGDGNFTKECTGWIKENTSSKHVFLTTSGSHALDMAAYLCALNPGDEVIMPSFTFSSTANAFVGHGAHIVFVDIRPDTMNIDEALIEDAITDRTKVIVPMHYAGVACEMDSIMALAKRYGLLVVEDAAQAVLTKYKQSALGAIADFGCYSFHETKNYSMGEGGALLVQNDDTSEKAEIIREKGTDRSRFFCGRVDKYSWQEWGSSYLPSELNAAYLWSQLECASDILQDRLGTWNYYYRTLLPWAEKGRIDLPVVPANCTHNAHLFYIKAKNLAQRTAFIAYLKNKGITAPYHYVPLHSAPAGQKYGRFHGEDRYTTEESNRLFRLPLYYGLGMEKAKYVVDSVIGFLEGK